MNQGERLARVEEQVKSLATKVEGHDKRFDEISDKLDELLALRNKGVGAFWLMTTLVGTGIVSGAAAFFKWILGN